jgi:hypothetical protein
MATKADDESKPNEAPDPRAGDLPLEDPRWVALIPEHRRLTERLSSGGLAAADFTKAMADGVVRCMGRRAGGRELVPPSFWVDYELDWGTRSGLGVRPRMRKSGAYVHVRGWVFFIWKPDVDKLWPANPSPPAEESKVEQEAESASSKGIPGRRPTRDWPIVVAVEVVRLARNGALERPTSTSMIEHCSKKINFSPPVKQMQLLLKTLWPE